MRIVLLLALVVGTVFGERPTAHAAGELELPAVTRTTLANGLRVVVAEYHELPLVELYTIVGAGAVVDPEGQEGVAALTATALTRGAGGRSAEELAVAIESLGARLEAASGVEGTIVWGEFLAVDFAAGLDLLRDVLRSPAFARDEIRRARDEQAAAIRADLENPSTIAEKCFAAFLYGSHPYGRPVEGLSTTVPDLGRGDVTDFYARWYHPNNTILVVVGDVTTADALARVESAFGTWPARPEAKAAVVPPPVAVSSRRVLLVDKPDSSQAQIRFGNVSLPRRAPEFLEAQVANTILGGGFTSRLIEELRVKRSLTYAAWSAFTGRRAGGDFRVATFTKTPTTAETLRLALEVEGAFRSAPPPAAALEKAKRYLAGQFPLRLESPDALAARLAEIEFQGLPPDELTTYRSRVAAVTPADVARVAAKAMPAPDRVAVVVVGKAADIRGPLEDTVGPVEVIPAPACERLVTPGT